MQSIVCELNSLGSYKYAVILSRYKGMLLLSRHRQRFTRETQGVHIEAGESPLEAARRELYKGSGALDFTLTPLFDYRAWDEYSAANGVNFLAEIRSLGDLPESEMAEVRPFDGLPENLTYPGIMPFCMSIPESRDCSDCHYSTQQTPPQGMCANPLDRIRRTLYTLGKSMNSKPKGKTI